MIDTLIVIAVVALSLVYLTIRQIRRRKMPGCCESGQCPFREESIVKLNITIPKKKE